MRANIEIRSCMMVWVSFGLLYVKLNSTGPYSFYMVFLLAKTKLLARDGSSLDTILPILAKNTPTQVFKTVKPTDHCMYHQVLTFQNATFLHTERIYVCLMFLRTATINLTGLNNVFTAGQEQESFIRNQRVNLDKSALLSDETPDYFQRVKFETLNSVWSRTPGGLATKRDRLSIVKSPWLPLIL